MVSFTATNSLISKEDSVPWADRKGDEATLVVSAIESEWSILLRISQFIHVSKGLQVGRLLVIRVAYLYMAWLDDHSIGLQSRIPTIQEC